MNENEFLSRVSHMYYKQNMDLKAISKVFNISYATISRTLKKAREIGIVSININNPSSRLLDLEATLKEKFKLKDVISVNVEEFSIPQDIKNLVAREASDYLFNVIKDGDVLGISWGSTLYQVISSFIMSRTSIKKKSNIAIVQLNGSYTSIPIEFNSLDLVRRMKNLFSGTYYFINSETIVDSFEMRDFLLESSSIKKTFLMHKSVNIALLGIGSFNKQSISELYKNYLRSEEIIEIENQKAVGENCLIFYDINGKIIKTSLYERTISIDQEDLLNIQNKIVIASGVEKSKAIIGAIKAKMIDVLITDRLTLEQILRNLN